MPRKRPIEDRFWEKVERTMTCWLWRGARDRRGYGRVSYNLKPKLAHRVAWEITFGPIPAGLHLCHRCDAPTCVNPAHLFLGTHADNMADAKEKRLFAQGERHWSRQPGHRLALVEKAHAARKVSEDQRTEIRSAIAAGDGVRATARRFGVTHSCVQHIVREGKV